MIKGMSEDRANKRLRAAELFAAGATRAEVARELGVSRTTSSQWFRVWQDAGAAGLGEARLRGRRARLDRSQESELRRALLAPPRASGLAVDQWSLAAVAAFVEARTGVRYHRRHVSRILRRLGWIIPPYGKHASEARVVHPMTDCDGNGLLLFQRPTADATRPIAGDDA
ncbi:MAG: helix-turn-helix domain-containing protein [Planctomycetota bacterium]